MSASLPFHFYLNLSFTILMLLYLLLSISCLLFNWNKPFLKARLPTFVLLTALGLLLRHLFLAINLFLILYAHSLAHYLQTQCIIGYGVYSVAAVLVSFPVLFRLCYIRRVGSIIQAFYTHSDEQLAKSRERRFIILVVVIMSLIFLSQFLYTVALIFSSALQRYACLCQEYDSAFLALAIALSIVIYSLQISAYLRYSCALCRHRTLLKYKIKLELLLLSFCCSGLKLLSFHFPRFIHCNAASSSFLSHPSTYITYALDFIILTVLIPFPFAANAKTTSTPDIHSLMFDFPEALFFWTPNFYFNQFLRSHYSHHVAY